tara:strand:- start:152956 stop:154788 length:1833 start_codon:yes stop_codon:yes gene_type:complete
MMPSVGAGNMFHDPTFLTELDQAARASGKTPAQARKYARKCLHEIEATPKDSWLQPAAKLARFVYTRSYEREMDINLEALEELRELSKDHLLLFLWSHKSHMDSFVFLLSLFDNAFRPLPLIFAGINMNFLGFGSLARRVGTIFLRRTFHEDPIYKLVFRSYIDYLIRNKLPLSWSIEGTRSRTGKLSPPKLGILNWVLESCQKEGVEKVLLVPVSIAFDRIAEVDDYVAIQRGEPKRKESLGWFFNYIFGMQQPYGKVYVRFAKPLALGEATSLSEDMSEGKNGERRLVTRMGFEVCTRIEQITPIKSADVLTMVLLGANGRALTAAEIHAQAADIASMVKARNLPAASGFRLDDEEQVRAAVLALQGSGLIKRYDKASLPVYYIPPGKQLAAAYYRNTITHFFLSAGLAEIGLAMCALGIDAPNKARLESNILNLRDLYKFEFFYKPTGEFLQEVQREAEQRYPNWSSGERSLQKMLREQPPRFGHAILRSISESYLVIAVTLLELDARPVQDRKKFIGHLMAQGQQMLLRRTISCEASVSQDLFATGLRQAEHLQLLDFGTELAARRQVFGERVVAALSAINLLQRSYDSNWFSELSAGKVSGLLGA